MKKATMTMTFAALMAILLLPATALLAQPPEGPGSEEPGFGRPGFERGFLRGRLAEELELSEAQKAEIETLRESHWEEIEPLMEQARESRQAVGDLMRADELDEAAVRSAAQQAADLHVELTVIRARHHSELRSVLTPEQQEKAAELREKWQERREEFRGRSGRGSGRGPRGAFGRERGRW